MQGSKKNDIDKQNKQLEYIYFSRAYLKLAYSGINNPISIPAAEKNILERYTEPNFIMAPILYNIKHAIELFIKFISKILDIEDKDFEKKHDIKLLFQKIQIKFNKISDDFDENVKKLEKLILKYHHLKFLNKKIGNNFIITDKTNDAFRYPDNKANIDLDFGSIFNQFGEKNFEEIKNDIAEFYNLFLDIGNSIINVITYKKERDEILDLIKKSPKITIKKLADELQTKSDVIEWRLSKLEQNGDLKRIGSDKGGCWEVENKSKKVLHLT